MPAYNFKPQFVPMIVRGEKTHTIRRRRKNHLTAPGDALFLYIGMRTKDAFMFAHSVCVLVEPVVIYPWRGELLKADHRGVYGWLSAEELLKLARADGFETVEAFFDFFKLYKLQCLDDFEIIHWDAKRLTVSGGAK